MLSQITPKATPSGSERVRRMRTIAHWIFTLPRGLRDGRWIAPGPFADSIRARNTYSPWVPTLLPRALPCRETPLPLITLSGGMRPARAIAPKQSLQFRTPCP